MFTRLEQITSGEFHPLAWLLGIAIGILTWLDVYALPHFVLWGSAGLVALGYWQKWRNRKREP